MQFKRWRIVPARRLVNASLFSGLIFLAACGAQPDPSAPEGDAPAPVAHGLELPAVWNTSDLRGRVSSVALAGGGASLMAVAYETGELELFDLEADRVAAVTPLDISLISDGAYADFGDAALVLFPAADKAGRLAGFVFGPGLPTPQRIDLPVTADGVVGLCSRGLRQDEDGLLTLAFWTQAMPQSAQVGTLRIKDGALSFEGTEQPRPENATACSFDRNGPVFADPGVGAIASINRPSGTQTVALLEDGSLVYRSAGSGLEPLGLRDGISVRVPDEIRDIAALGEAFGGGYPEGLIVVAGQVGLRDQVVFVDAGALTRRSLSGVGE